MFTVALSSRLGRGINRYQASLGYTGLFSRSLCLRLRALPRVKLSRYPGLDGATTTEALEKPAGRSR